MSRGENLAAGDRVDPHAFERAPALGALREWSVPVAASLWVVLVFLVRWPALWEPSFVSDSMIDSAFFAYAGELVRTGGTPYITFWDHKAPLIFLLNAAALALGGGAVWGLWLLNVAVFITAILLGHSAMKHAFGSTPALLGTTYFAFSVAAMMPANLTEGYVLPLQWGAVLLLVTWGSARRSSVMLGVVLGVLGALAFFLRANLIGAAVSVGLALVIMLLAQRRTRECIALVIGGLSGAALVTLPLLAYLISVGALSAFWDQAFHYNFLYSGSELRSKAGAFYFGAMRASQYGSAVIPFVGWALYARRLWSARHDAIASPVYLLALIWLPVELLLASMAGRQYGHYFAASCAPLALLAAAFVVEVTAIAPAVLARGQGALVFRLLALGTALIAVATTALHVARDKTDRERRMQVTQTAEYVRANTGEAESILVWGHAAEVHFLSGRGPASRFVYPLPLLTPRYADAALVSTYLHEIKTAAPRLIIDATPNALESEDLVPSLAKWDPTWQFPKSTTGSRPWWSMTPELKSIYDYVHANYVPVETVGPKQWVVYRLAQPSSSAGSTTGR
ncbi:MAG: hypothetical protein H0X13_16815 [Ramlibacter sp.]|nr:hypothetical protein [Ramlibacter sp.]